MALSALRVRHQTNETASIHAYYSAFCLHLLAINVRFESRLAGEIQNNDCKITAGTSYPNDLSSLQIKPLSNQRKLGPNENRLLSPVAQSN